MILCPIFKRRKACHVTDDQNGLSWPAHLDDHFRNACFQEISLDPFELLPELYGPFMQGHLFAVDEASFSSMKNDGPEAQGPKFRKLLAEVYEECQTGVTMTESPVVVVGRKPT